MKTFEELLEENGVLAKQVQTQAAEIATVRTELGNFKGLLEGAAATLKNLETGHAQIKANLLEAVKGVSDKVDATTARVGTLETTKADFEKSVAAQVARLGIGNAATSAAAAAGTSTGTTTPEALAEAYANEKDPMKAGELFAQWQKALRK
jgi:chaperonin cofactor prefoldin